MIKIKVAMKGIYSLDNLKTKSINKKNGENGIYLWGVKNGSRYISLYVGKDRNIHERIFQHLCRWRGGEYRVPAWDDIINLKTNSPSFVRNSKLLYIPHGPLVYKDFLSNTDIQYSIQKVLDNFFCCWEILSDGLNAYDEEDALATLIIKENLISSHRKNDTPETPFTKQFYKEFKEATKKPSP